MKSAVNIALPDILGTKHMFQTSKNIVQMLTGQTVFISVMIWLVLEGPHPIPSQPLLLVAAKSDCETKGFALSCWAFLEPTTCNQHQK